MARTREQYRDIEAPIEEWRCLKCHVNGEQDEDAVFAEGFRREEGVGCEACHRLPGEETCLECHQGGGFHFDERFRGIAHPRPGSPRAK